MGGGNVQTGTKIDQNTTRQDCRCSNYSVISPRHAAAAAAGSCLCCCRCSDLCCAAGSVAPRVAPSGRSPRTLPPQHVHPAGCSGGGERLLALQEHLAGPLDPSCMSHRKGTELGWGGYGLVGRLKGGEDGA